MIDTKYMFTSAVSIPENYRRGNVLMELKEAI